MMFRVLCFGAILTATLVLVQAKVAQAQYSFTATATVTPTGGQSFTGTYTPNPQVRSIDWKKDVTIAATVKFEGLGPASSMATIQTFGNVGVYYERPNGDGTYTRMGRITNAASGSRPAFVAQFDSTGRWNGAGGDAPISQMKEIRNNDYGEYQRIHFNAVPENLTVQFSGTLAIVNAAIAPQNNIFNVYRPLTP